MKEAENLVNDFVIQDSYARGLMGRPSGAARGTSAEQAYANGAATRRSYLAKIVQAGLNEANQRLAVLEAASAKQA